MKNSSYKDIKLFPKNLPDNEWSSFNAEGYNVPVSGIIYKDGSVKHGMPIGGLGTGFISLGTDGTLDYYSTIFNAFLERHEVEFDTTKAGPKKPEDVPSLKIPFLGLILDEKTWVLSLNDINGVNKTKQIYYWGHYPVADLIYDIDAPLDIEMRAWSSFCPGDANVSNTPGVIFQVNLKNISEKRQKGSLIFNFHGPRREEIIYCAHGKRQSFDGKPVFNRIIINEDLLNGVKVNNKWEDLTYEYIICALGEKSVRLGKGISNKDWKDVSNYLPEPGMYDPGASISVDFELDPQENKTIKFLLTWHAPIWRAQGQTMWINETFKDYKHMYSSRFKNALEVAKYLSKNGDLLLKKIISWQESIFENENIPEWLKDSLINVLALIPQNSFWAKNLDHKHWWGKDGFFCINESLITCPQQGCIANDFIGQWPIDLLFPKLAKNKLRAYKHYQKNNGQVPSTLGMGTELDYPWYDQQLATEGPIYIQMVDRIWQVTKDDKFLTEYYPSVKKQLKFMFSVDQDNDGLIDVNYCNQFYDDVNWKDLKGAAIHIAGFWIATLLIVKRMAERFKDKIFIKEIDLWIKKGKKSIEEKLWNEKAGSYLLSNKPEESKRLDFVLADQLVGQWLVYIHGVPHIFSEERVKKVLETIWKLNVASTKFGVRVAIKPDATFAEGAVYLNLVMSSYASIVPSMLSIYNGDFKKGNDLLKKVFKHMVIDLKLPWNLPLCFNADDGEIGWGMQYYEPTQLWSTLATYLGVNISSLCSPGGFISKLKSNNTK